MDRSDQPPSTEVMNHANHNAQTATHAVFYATHELGPTYIATFITALAYNLSMIADHTLIAAALKQAAERILQFPPMNAAPPPPGVKPS